MERRKFLRNAVLGGTAFTIGSTWPGILKATAGPGPYGPLQPADGNGVQLPSGNRLDFSSQRTPGRTYEITGPFRS